MAIAVAPVVRIRPARWFAHADGLVALGGVVQTRARALECGHDPKAPFARRYAAYVAAVTDAVERGDFGDATPWIASLVVDHANGWLRSMDSYDRAQYGLVPGAWRGIFARQRHGLSEGDSLRISLAAHLLFDLPMALGRVDPGPLSRRAVDVALRTHGRILLHSFGYGGLLSGRGMRRVHGEGCLAGVALAASISDAGRSVIFERVRIASLRAIAP